MKTTVRSALGAVVAVAVLAGPLPAQQPAQQPTEQAAQQPAQPAAQPAAQEPKPEVRKEVRDLIKGEVVQAVAVLGADGIQRVEILGGGYFYKPNYVIVKVNVPVEITIRKEAGYVPHDFEIKAPEAGINVTEQMDTTPKVVKFTPTKAGTYPFYCGKKLIFTSSHRDKGMKGVLEVQ
jgi:plastocyanin